MGDTHIYYSQHHNIITQHSPAKSATWLLIFPHNILNRLSFMASDRAIAKQTGRRIMLGSARGCDFVECVVNITSLLQLVAMCALIPRGAALIDKNSKWF